MRLPVNTNRSPNFESLENVADAELIQRAGRDDREAYGELVRRYESLVYSVALARLGQHAEAQELTQEVFVQAMRKIGQLRAPESFGKWLRSITVRMAINRRMRRRPLVEAEPEVLAGVSVDPVTPLARVLEAERARQVQQGLARLGDLDRRTLLAFYMDGRSLDEMSDQFHSPVGTIKRRLHVARKRLAKHLQEVAAV